MRERRWLRYAFLAGSFGILIYSFTNLLFPAILGSRLLFGGLVALLLVGGMVPAVGAAREMFRR